MQFHTRSMCKSAHRSNKVSFNVQFNTEQEEGRDWEGLRSYGLFNYRDRDKDYNISSYLSHTKGTGR